MHHYSWIEGSTQRYFLELGNGEKILSKGYVPDGPVVITGLTVKVGLTVTKLLHGVDLTLGINWSSGKGYLPNEVHTALLQGDWLVDHVKVGIVTVLSSEDDLQKNE